MTKEDSVEYMAFLQVLKGFGQLDIKQCIWQKENCMGKRQKHRTDLETSGQLYLAELHGTWIKVVEVRLQG